MKYDFDLPLAGEATEAQSARSQSLAVKKLVMW